MDLSMVAMHLEPYGYAAASAEDWKEPASSSASRPRLRLDLQGHSEMGKHTHYILECKLSAERPPLQLVWQSQKRLAQLREELHDTVKNEMGKDYPDVFAAAPFAKRGGWHGTSERLKKWLETLADCVNGGVAPPILVSQILLFFDAPAQSEHQASAEAVREDSSGSPSLGAQASPALETAELAAPASRRMPSADRSTERSESAERDSPECRCDIAVASREVDPPSLITEHPLSTTTTKSSSSTSAAEPVASRKVEDYLRALWVTMARDDPVGYLRAYGYAAESSTLWCNAPASCLGRPVIRLLLGGHSEHEGHTYYSVQCQLSAELPLLRLDWKVEKRLLQLREELHDVVKDCLGKNYGDLFSQAPFARRGGLSGTTGRLQTWLETLASCVNEHSVAPDLAAIIMQRLETPSPPKPSKGGPASSQTIRNKVILQPEVSGDALPQEQTRPTPEVRAPSPLPVGVPPASGYSDAACSPFKFDQAEDQTEEAVGHDPGALSSDDENTSEAPAEFSKAKRHRGYRKLRNFFMELKRSLEKKLHT